MKRRVEVDGYVVPRYYASPYWGMPSSGDAYLPKGIPDRHARFASDVCSEAGRKACGALGCGFSSGKLSRVTAEHDVRISHNVGWDFVEVQDTDETYSHSKMPEKAVLIDPVYIGWSGSDAFCWKANCGDGINDAIRAAGELGELRVAKHEFIKPNFDALRERNRIELLRAAVSLGKQGYLLAAYVDPLYIGRYLKDGDLDSPYRSLRDAEDLN